MANDPQVEAIVSGLKDLASDVVRKITLDIVANLSDQPPQGTPIETGWARTNWVPHIGAPYTGLAGTPESISPFQQQFGVASMYSYKLDRGKVFISNNVPYIVRLNEGSSLQSPAGFVQAAIHKALTEDLFSI